MPQAKLIKKNKNLHRDGFVSLIMRPTVKTVETQIKMKHKASTTSIEISSTHA